MSLKLSLVLSAFVAYNVLQAGTVCILKQCLPKCLFKDTNVCCFCKNEKNSLPKFLQKLLARLRKLGLLVVMASFIFQ